MADWVAGIALTLDCPPEGGVALTTPSEESGMEIRRVKVRSVFNACLQKR
jgi:hypothetical protein